MELNARIIFGFSMFVLIVITLFIVAFSLLTSSGGGGGSTRGAEAITDHINNRSQINYYRRGRIIADENHRGYRIEITQSRRKIEIVEGYEQVVVDQRTYPNNRQAYEELVYALTRTGFRGVTDPEKFEIRGTCAVGRLSLYEMTEGSDFIARQWQTSCGFETVELRGVSNLLEAQIPDFTDVVRGLNL